MKIKTAIRLMFVSFALILASCGNSRKDDVMELLKNVPSEAEFVAVGSPEDISGGAAGSEDMNKVPTAGVNTSALVAFSSEGRFFITGMLDNAKDFMADVEKKSGEKFVTEAGVEIADHYAVSGNRFFYAVSGRISAETVKKFIDTTENNSYSANKYAPKLAETDADVAFIGNMNVLCDYVGGEDMAQVRLGLNMAFKDPVWLAGTLNSEKGAAVVNIGLLDSGYKPAKFQFESAEIDAKTLSYLRGGNIVAALAVSDDMKERLATLAGGMGGNQFRDLISLLGGNVALSVSADGKNGSFAVQTASAADAGKLLGMLESLAAGYTGMSLSVQDNHVVGVEGGSTDSLAPEVIQEMKGCYMALWTNVAASDSYPAAGFSEILLKVVPEGESVKIDMKMTLKDRNSNFWSFITTNA